MSDFAHVYSHSHNIVDGRINYTPKTVLGQGVRITYHATILSASAITEATIDQLAALWGANERLDPTGELEAIRMALDDAGLGPDDIDYVCAHGTSTEANDANETQVLKEVFGRRAYEIPVAYQTVTRFTEISVGCAGAHQMVGVQLDPPRR